MSYPSFAGKTMLGRARGLGSARRGVGHWRAQRLSAIALIPLSVWLLWAGVSLAEGGATHAAVSAWLAAPVNAVLLSLFVAAAAHHGRLGVQVVVEDYVHHPVLRPVLLGGLAMLAYVTIAAGLFAILKVALAA